MRLSLRIGLVAAAIVIAALSMVHPGYALLPRVLVIGDSTSATVTLRKAQNAWPSILSRKLNVLTHVFAVPGARMGGGGISMDENTAAWAYLDFYSRINVTIVLMGHNDWSAGIPLESFRDAYRVTVDTMAARGGAIVCVTPLPTINESKPPPHGPLTLEDFRAAVRQVCAGHLILEGPALLPLKAGYYADGIHPSDAGSRRLGGRISQQIAYLL